MQSLDSSLISDAMRQLRANNVYVLQLTEDMWEAESQSRADKRYIIDKQDDGEFACTCKDSFYRGTCKCKHVRAVLQTLELV